MSRNGAPEINQPPDLLRRGGQPLRRGPRPAAGVRLPARRELGRRRRARRRWTGGHGRAARLDAQPAAVRAPLPRPRPADLATRSPRTASCCSTGRSSDRLRRIAPFLEYDKDPYLVVDDDGAPRLRPGRVHDQRPFPHAHLVQRLASWARESGLCRRRVQLHPEQRQDHDGRVRRHDALLRVRPHRPAHPRLAGHLPVAVPADGPDGRRRAPRTSASPRSSSTSRPGSTAQYHVDPAADVLQQHRPLDGPGQADEPAEPRVRGLLRRDADAGRAEGGVPAAPADDRREPAEHDRVGGRPQRRPELRRTSGSTGSRPTRRSSGRPRSRRGSTRTRSISAQISLWNQSGSSVVRGNLIVVPVGDSLLYLQPVYLQSTVGRVPGVPEDRGGQPHDDRVGRLAGRGADAAARRSRARAARRPTPPPTTGPTPTPGAVGDAGPARRRRPAAGCRPTSPGWSSTRTRTSRPPRRRSGTATSPRTARRWTRSRPRSRARRAHRGAARSHDHRVTAARRSGRRRGRRRRAVRLRWGATVSGRGRRDARPAASRGPSGSLGSSRAAGSSLVAWPILVLPTPTGPPERARRPGELARVRGAVGDAPRAASSAGSPAAWCWSPAALLVGAWAERQGIGIALEAAAEEGIVRRRPTSPAPRATGRVALVRLLSLAPVAVAIALAWRPLYDVDLPAS